MLSAIQFTSCTTIPRRLVWFFCGFGILRSGRSSFFDGEVDDRSEHRADDDPQKLEPVKERDPNQGGLDSIVKGRPESDGKLDDEEQVPPAPSAPLLLCTDHAENLPGQSVRGGRSYAPWHWRVDLLRAGSHGRQPAMRPLI